MKLIMKYFKGIILLVLFGDVKTDVEEGCSEICWENVKNEIKWWVRELGMSGIGMENISVVICI